MKQSGGATLIAIVTVVVTVLLVCGLVQKDRACVASGGTVVVVSEHQAKGTMNHTECR